MRYACGVEYDGTDFAGWQSQRHARSVQETLNGALSQVADQPIVAHGAGRTDAGVHAAGQVVHFDTNADRNERQWLLGVNSALPADVALTWIKPVPDDFDARRCALWRRYRYSLTLREARSPLDRERSLWVRRPLDIGAMLGAASYLLGEHDFSAFRAAGCQSTTPMRHLMAIGIIAQDDRVFVDVTANAFLQHMVRILMGVLLAVGWRDQPPSWSAAVLTGRDRRLGGVTVPPQGLRLLRVAYPKEYGLPDAGER